MRRTAFLAIGSQTADVTLIVRKSTHSIVVRSACAVYFRYVSAAERDYIFEQNCVLSFSGITFLSPECYESWVTRPSGRFPYRPEWWRVGAIPGELVTEVVKAATGDLPFGQPGGGWE
ncbi:MAG: hypothetical protein R2762_11390 [Bryobacteraceae bacterium]